MEPRQHQQIYRLIRAKHPGLTGVTAAATAAGSLLQGLGLLQYGRRASAANTASAASPEQAAATDQQSSTVAGVLQQSCKVAGKTWTFETGRLAGLAHGSCLVTVGGTSVLGTAVVDPTPQQEADGVPLQVEYRERMSAAGRLPSRPDRRERVGTEREVLAARLIDRALRPLLPPGFLYDTQVWVQVLSADGGIDPEVVAINAASAALLLAPQIPFTHPVGAVKVRCLHKLNKGWRYSINSSVDALYHRNSITGGVSAGPSKPTSSSSSTQVAMSLVYAGSPCKATAIEAAGEQTAEHVFVDAMKLAATSTRPLIATQQALAAATAAAQQQQQQQQQQQWQLPLLWPGKQLQQTVAQLAEQPLRSLFTQQQQQQQQQSGSSGSSAKGSRAAALTAIQAELLRDLQRTGVLAEAGQSAVAAAGQVLREDALRAFDVLQSKVMREVLLGSEGSWRVDGRGVDELRPIGCEAGPLPRTVHGSGLFTRGETQSLATATVGHDTEVAPMESLWGRRSNSNPLHLHYSFPPFCVAEIGKQGMPNRREVGHGNLARAGIAGLMPSEEEFPFSVRVTADTLSSSGSSSMAAVCAASLALKTAGVPTSALAAGISVGLVSAAPPQLGDAVSASTNSSTSGGSSDDGQQQQEAGAGIDPSSYSSFVAAGFQRPRKPGEGDASSSSSSSSSSSDSDGEAEGTSTSSSSSSSGSDDDAAMAGSSGDSSQAADGQVLDSTYGAALLLTDIQGIEDHLGDMDFKVAGTQGGITAVQLDTKLPGVDLHILEAALQPAAAARRKILAAMEAAVKAYESSTPAIDMPQSGGVQIMKELVPRLIGPQGTTLTDIEETCGASLIVEDSGTINVYAPTQMRYQHALAAVQEVEGRGIVQGEVYRVRVLKVVDFGAYVALPNGLPALLHVSQLSHERIREIRDVVAEGQEFDVVCKGRDSKGFVQLSKKDLLPVPEGLQQQQQQQQGPPAAVSSSTTGDLAAAVAAAAGAALGGSSGSSSSSSSMGRQSQQHHVQHHADRPSKPGRAPRAMTWRPPAGTEGEKQQ